MTRNGRGNPIADGSSNRSSASTEPADLAGTNQAWRVPVTIGFLAALTRLIWVAAMSRAPKGLHDPAIYAAAAKSIANGDGYRSITGTVTSYYPPGYPFFLGAVRWITDLVGLDSHFVLIVGLIQACLGGITAASVVIIGRRLASDSVGLVAGLIIVVWPNLVIHASLLLSESVFLAVLGVLVAAVSVMLTDENQRTGVWAVAGVAMGAAMLIRPQAAIVVLPALVIALVISKAGARRTITFPGVLIVGILVLVGPWVVRNWVVLGAPVVSTNTGDNLCIGFHPGATGGFAMPDDCQTEYSYTDGPDREISRDAELRRKAISAIVDDPAALPMLSVHKLTGTFSTDHDALRALESFDSDRFLSSGTRGLIRWSSDIFYFVILVSAIIGMVLSVVRVTRSDESGTSKFHETADYHRAGTWNLLLITIFGVLVPVVGFGEPRFKVPLSICLAVWSAIGLLAVREVIGVRHDPQPPPGVARRRRVRDAPMTP